jgi:RsiW-degrading membrane proteinase PrsW (M82 family)
MAVSPSLSRRRRVVIWTCIVVLLTFIYWNALVNSLNGSIVKAGLVVVFAWTVGSIDVNEMVGQPHDD